MADPWTRTAVLLASGNCAREMIEEVAHSERLARRPEANEFIGLLAHIIGTANDEADVTAVLEQVTNFSWPGGSTQKMIVLRELADGMAKSGRPLLDQIAKNENLKILFQEAGKTSGNSAKTVEERVDSIQLLAFAPYEILELSTARLLEGNQPPAISRQPVILEETG